MPAAFAASTPVGASSNTRQAEGGGAGAQVAAACRKMSGAGLPVLTWSPDERSELELGSAAEDAWQARD